MDLYFKCMQVGYNMINTVLSVFVHVKDNLGAQPIVLIRTYDPRRKSFEYNLTFGIRKKSKTFHIYHYCVECCFLYKLEHRSKLIFAERISCTTFYIIIRDSSIILFVPVTCIFIHCDLTVYNQY